MPPLRENLLWEQFLLCFIAFFSICIIVYFLLFIATSDYLTFIHVLESVMSTFFFGSFLHPSKKVSFPVFYCFFIMLTLICVFSFNFLLASFIFFTLFFLEFSETFKFSLFYFEYFCITLIVLKILS